MQLAPTRIFAHALLGTVDDVTKETMDKNPGKYHVGDQVGYGGSSRRTRTGSAARPASRW